MSLPGFAVTNNDVNPITLFNGLFIDGTVQANDGLSVVNGGMNSPYNVQDDGNGNAKIAGWLKVSGPETNSSAAGVTASAFNGPLNGNAASATTAGTAQLATNVPAGISITNGTFSGNGGSLTKPKVAIIWCNGENGGESVATITNNLKTMANVLATNGWLTRTRCG